MDQVLVAQLTWNGVNAIHKRLVLLRQSCWTMIHPSALWELIGPVHSALALYQTKAQHSLRVKLSMRAQARHQNPFYRGNIELVYVATRHQRVQSSQQEDTPTAALKCHPQDHWTALPLLSITVHQQEVQEITHRSGLAPLIPESVNRILVNVIPVHKREQ